MSVSVLEGSSEGTKVAVFLNGDSDCAFGPTMNDAAEAEAFQEWLPLPAEDYSDEALCDRLTEFRQGQLATEGGSDDEMAAEVGMNKQCTCGAAMEFTKAPKDALVFEGSGDFWTCPACGKIDESK